MNENFLHALLGSISVSGYEEPVQDIVEEEMKDYVDEIRRDEMQNLTCILNPDSDVKIMLSAHADEIGLMISNIREDGKAAGDRQRRNCSGNLSGAAGKDPDFQW